jgi:hypothetical protein
MHSEIRAVKRSSLPTSGSPCQAVRVDTHEKEKTLANAPHKASGKFPPKTDSPKGAGEERPGARDRDETGGAEEIPAATDVSPLPLLRRLFWPPIKVFSIAVDASAEKALCGTNAYLLPIDQLTAKR